MPLSRSDVEKVYRRSLGRPPESDAVVDAQIAACASQEELRREIWKSPEYKARAVGALASDFAKTDGYQAIYSLPALSSADARACRDRCEAIERYFRNVARSASIAHLAIADIGCAQGYVSLYFADQGARVLGIDYNLNNIGFCANLTHISGLNAEFENHKFDEDIVSRIIEDGFNAVYFLSVLHHIISDNGLSWTKAQIARLIENNVILICELAQADEPVTFPWRTHLPDDILSIFPPGTSIEKIGEFSALNGLSTRSLYAIRRGELRYLQVEKQEDGLIYFGPLIAQPIREFRLSSVTVEPVREKLYFSSDRFFAKVKITNKNNIVQDARIAHSEFMNGTYLSDFGIVPNIIGFSQSEREIVLVYEFIDGEMLSDFAIKSSMKDRRACAVLIARHLEKMNDCGIFWNDVRDHNILITKTGTPVFLDLENASIVSLEDNTKRALWILWHLCHSDDYGDVGAGCSTELLPAPPRVSPCKEWSAIVQSLNADMEDKWPEFMASGQNLTLDARVGQRR